MPASEVMSLYRQKKLHSGPGGPIVKSKKQAVAIQISMARKEGHHIPKPDSYQQGGLVPETGPAKLHQGETVLPPPPDIGQAPLGPASPPISTAEAGPAKPRGFNVSFGGPGGGGKDWLGRLRANVNAPLSRSSGVDIPGVPSFRHGGLVPETGIYQMHRGEFVVPHRGTKRATSR